MTTEQFILKQSKTHIIKYIFDKIENPKARENILIGCPICKQYFKIRTDSFLAGRNCICQSKTGRKKTTLKEFVERARKIFGKEYCYSLVKFNDLNDKVDIICQKHSIFSIKAFDHLNGAGCRLCQLEKQKKLKEDFIKDMKQKFGDVYDYSSLPETITIDQEIQLKCNICGMTFNTTRKKMQMEYTPCPNCYSKLRGKQRTKSFEWFKEKAEKMHPNKYIYYKDRYVNTRIKMKVFCKACQKDFSITPQKILTGYGCQDCGIKSSATSRMLSQDEVEKELIKACEDKYIFEPFKYDSIRTILKFHCKKHKNTFFQTFSSFKTNGICCPNCKPKSKAEYIVRKYLEENNINFISNTSMNGLYDEKPLLPDFFLIDLKIMIEVQGIQHSEPIDFSGKLTKEEMDKKFHKQKHHDWLKRKYCRERGYRFEEIWFFENTIEKLKTILK